MSTSTGQLAGRTGIQWVSMATSTQSTIILPQLTLRRLVRLCIALFMAAVMPAAFPLDACPAAVAGLGAASPDARAAAP